MKIQKKIKTTGFSTSSLRERKNQVSEMLASSLSSATMEPLKTESVAAKPSFPKTKSPCMPVKSQKDSFNSRKKVFYTETSAHATFFCTTIKLNSETLIVHSFTKSLNAVILKAGLISTQPLNKSQSWLLCQTKNFKQSETSSFSIFSPNAIFTSLE